MLGFAFILGVGAAVGLHFYRKKNKSPSAPALTSNTGVVSETPPKLPLSE